MCTLNLPGGKGRPVRKADNLTAICLENVGVSMSHNPMGLHGLLTGIPLPFYMYYVHIKGLPNDEKMADRYELQAWIMNSYGVRRSGFVFRGRECSSECKYSYINGKVLYLRLTDTTRYSLVPHDTYLYYSKYVCTRFFRCVSHALSCFQRTHRINAV
jgi:hypothetical protein